MITEIVTFALPPGSDRASALALYKQTADKWVANADLIQKYYFIDEERCLGGGVYFWRSREDAARWHGDEFRTMIKERYGSEPSIEIFDALLHVDPPAGKITEI